MNKFLKLVLTAFVFVSVTPAIQASDALTDGAEENAGGTRKRSASSPEAFDSKDQTGASSSSGSVQITPSEPTGTKAVKGARWAFVGQMTQWITTSRAVKWLASWIYKDVTENPQRAKSRLAFLANKKILIPASAIAAGAFAYWYDADTVTQFAWTIIAPALTAYAGTNGDATGAGITGTGDTGTGTGSVNTGGSPAPITQYPNSSVNPF
ncbi:MAG: hypothetical protein ACTHJ4_05630 [Candidatus Nucleicultricaceae bacterium]|jgi:hypothetical protein